MTPEQDAQFLSIIERAAAAEERIAAYLQRLADHFAPIEKRTGKAAVLTTAKYKREEEPQPPRRAATTVKGG